MNKTKSFFKSSFFALSLFLSSIVPVSMHFANLEKKEQTISFEEKKIATNNLKSDIENLTFSVNLYDETINYDIAFKKKKFNGTKVNSFFYYAKDSEQTINAWEKVAFNNSTATVSKRHASNKASYHDQLINLSNSNPEGSFLNHNGTISLGVVYEKDGKMVSATKNWIEFNLLDENLIKMDHSQTKMVVNDNLTFAEINFSLLFDDVKMNINYISLKSHSNSYLNQVIFTSDNYSLIQGKNKINTKLLNQKEYKDLYLEFVFDNYRGGQYLFNSDFDTEINFVSGKNNEWSATSISLLTITLILVVVMIIFIVLLLKSMKRRKELEKLNDQTYYEQNFE